MVDEFWNAFFCLIELEEVRKYRLDIFGPNRLIAASFLEHLAELLRFEQQSLLIRFLTYVEVLDEFEFKQKSRNSPAQDLKLVQTVDKSRFSLGIKFDVIPLYFVPGQDFIYRAAFRVELFFQLDNEW